MMTPEPLRILLVEDDVAFSAALMDSFAIAELEVELHADGQSALSSIAASPPAVVITDVRMPRLDGNDLLDAVLAVDPEVPVIMMTGHGDIAMAVSALKRGAYDFIEKPFVTEYLIASVRRALETRRLVLENRRLRQMAAENEGHFPLLGQTAVMTRVRDTVRQVAGADVDVLLEGETGTGKELVAHLLHRWSRRQRRAFVAIDCAALPEGQADELLFGGRIRRGRLAEAHRGTLFLDGVEHLSPTLQGRLLRAIEEREVVSPSGETTVLDVRVVASATQDVQRAVAEGRLRADFVYRLSTVKIHLPPLRERRADVGVLFSYFLDEASRQHGVPRPAIGAEVEARLLTDDWPGNVRELRNFATQLALGLVRDPIAAAQGLGLSEQMDIFEAGVLRKMLEQCDGDAGRAADALHLPRRSLYARLQKHGIVPRSYRGRE